MCSASWMAVGTQLIPPSNQPTRRPGWRSRMPAEDVLAERVAERRDVVHHADDDAVELVRRRRRALADVVGDRQPGVLDRRPTPRPSRCSRSRSGACPSSLPGVERHQEGVEPQRLQLLERAAGAVGVPPVDQPDAVECGRWSAPAPRRCARCRCGSRAHAPPGRASRTAPSTAFGKASSRWIPSESSAARRASMSSVCDPGESGRTA